jgi:single-strand DNA-binding protein
VNINYNFYVGRLTADPALSPIGEQGVAKFSLAIKRDYKNNKGDYDVDFIPCEAWGKNAVNVHKYLKKGDILGVSGKLEINRTSKEGDSRYYPKVKVKELHFYPNSNRGQYPNMEESIIDRIPPFYEDESPY